ncbi:MAG TPA: alpha/beta hydrolase [Anaeromyxobacter sp.]
MRKLILAVCLTAAALAVPAHASALEYQEGSIGPGTVYGIWVPDAWNGDLVLYAHGFRNPNCPLAVPTTPGAICLGGDSGTPQAVRPVRDALLAMGYAFAASSYSDTALALKEGAEQTFQLKKIFGARVAPPRRTWLWGHSMGGAILVKLAEQHSGEFDGAVAACGMIGGSPTEFRYVANARAVFDWLFPGVVPGGVASMPAGLTFYGDVVPKVLPLFQPSHPDFQTNAAKLLAWAAISQIQYRYRTFPELVKGALELLYFQTLGTPGVLAAAHGFPSDTRDVEYALGAPIPWLDLAALNAGVERVAADPESLAYAEHWYDPTGALEIPMITLHTVADAAVPPVHEDVYRAKVKAAGREHLLVQREFAHDPATEPPDGHCTFKPAEELAAFADLVEWVESGRRPEGATIR